MNVRLHAHPLGQSLTRDGNLTRPLGGAVEHGLLDGVHVLEVRVGRDVEHRPGGRSEEQEEMQRRRKSSTRHDMTLMRNRVLRAKKWLWHVSTINDGDGQRRRRVVAWL